MRWEWAPVLLAVVLVALSVHLRRRAREAARARRIAADPDLAYEAFPQRRLSGFERFFVILGVVLVAPIVASPWLSLRISIVLIPTLVVGWIAWSLGQDLVRRRRAASTAPRRLDLVSKLGPAKKVSHHWTVNESEPRNSPERK